MDKNFDNENKSLKSRKESWRKTISLTQALPLAITTNTLAFLFSPSLDRCNSGDHACLQSFIGNQVLARKTEDCFSLLRQGPRPREVSNKHKPLKTFSGAVSVLISVYFSTLVSTLDKWKNNKYVAIRRGRLYVVQCWLSLTCYSVYSCFALFTH